MAGEKKSTTAEAQLARLDARRARLVEKVASKKNVRIRSLRSARSVCTKEGLDAAASEINECIQRLVREQAQATDPTGRLFPADEVQGT